MDNLSPPDIDVKHHRIEFRRSLLSTKKSAALGAVFLLLPFLFISGVILKHYGQLDVGFLTSVYEWIGDMDRKYGDDSWMNWLIRFLLLAGPVIGASVNLMAITHIRFERSTREMIISVKARWVNLIILIICTLLFSVFITYLSVENLR